MAYLSDIPNATDLIDASQSQIKDNFGAIKTLIDVNHVTFDATGQGKHKHISMPVVSAAPASAAGEGTFFTKAGTVTPTESEPYYTKINGGTEYNMLTQFGGTTSGWARLPGGLIMKWGTTAVSGQATVTYPTGATIPAFTTVYNAQVSVLYTAAGDGNKAISIRAINNPLQLNVYMGERYNGAGHPASGNIYYLAIGV